MKYHPTLNLDIYVELEPVVDSVKSSMSEHEKQQLLDNLRPINTIEDLAVAFCAFLEVDNVIDDFHKSDNIGSQSWYITFHRKSSEDSFRIYCVFHYRISDHSLGGEDRNNQKEREQAHRKYYLDTVVPNIERDTGKKIQHTKFSFVEAILDNQTYFSYEELLETLIHRVNTQRG